MSLTTNENTDGTLSRDRSNSPMDDEGSFEGMNNETVVLKKGPWTSAEDEILIGYVKKHGEGNWNAVQKNTGLLRCGKSCRLRWANHLRPNLKKGAFTEEEEKKIIEFHAKMGNKWAKMASLMDGRTDNEIKNYWNTRTKRLQRAGLPLYPPELCMQMYKENQQNTVANGIHNEDEGHYNLMQSNHEIPDVRFDSLSPNHGFFPYAPDIPSPVYNLVPSTTVHRQKRLRESANLFSGYSGDFVSAPFLPFEDDIHENISLRPFNSLPFGVNGDFSASRHNLVPVKKELPSFQTEIGSWGSSSLEPHFPEPVDVFIQSPEPSGPDQAQEDNASPRNSGLLDALVYEAKALNRGKNKLSDKSSSSSRVSPGDISNSSSVDVCMTEWKDHGEPMSPLGNSITSYFSECTPMSATGSSLVESPLGETFPGYNPMLEQVDWSWTLDGETKETRNQIDFSRPDALLGACWFKPSVSRGKDQGSTSGAVSDFSAMI